MLVLAIRLFLCGIANDDHLRLFSDPSFLIDFDQYNFWSSNEQSPSGSAIDFNQRRKRRRKICEQRPKIYSGSELAGGMALLFASSFGKCSS